jgi:hypothetical protein
VSVVGLLAGQNWVRTTQLRTKFHLLLWAYRTAEVQHEKDLQISYWAANWYDKEADKLLLNNSYEYKPSMPGIIYMNIRLQCLELFIWIPSSPSVQHPHSPLLSTLIPSAQHPHCPLLSTLIPSAQLINYSEEFPQCWGGAPRGKLLGRGEMETETSETLTHCEEWELNERSYSIVPLS